jgi:ribosomal protein S12 methylthiotransferase accessory factor YcaO
MMNHRLRMMRVCGVILAAAGFAGVAVGRAVAEPFQERPPQTAPSQLPPRPERPTKPAIKADQISKEQFARLPDDQIIDVRGSLVTAGELRAKQRQQDAEMSAKLPLLAKRVSDQFDAYRAKFLADQNAKLDAENARVEAIAAALR